MSDRIRHLLNSCVFGSMFAVAMMAPGPTASLVSFGFSMPFALAGDEEIYKQEKVPGQYRDLARGVGLLADDRGFCTAFCVKPDIVATAAHCIAKGRANVTRTMFGFSAGDRARTPIMGSSKAEKLLHTTTGTTRFPAVGKKLGDADEPFFDWALVRLQNPVCEGRTLELYEHEKIPEPGDSEKVFSIFFQPSKRRPVMKYAKCSQDRFSYFSFTRRSSSFARENAAPFPDDFVYRKCDIRPGGSGAPVFLDSGDGVKVIAIHSTHSWPTNGKNPNFEGSVNVRNIEPYLHYLETPGAGKGNDSIKVVQELLKKTGDYSGAIDGVYGLGTRQAILDFTLRNSLPVPFDHPIPELVPILELHASRALGRDLVNAIEGYMYNPGVRHHKAFAYHSDTRTFAISGGKLSASKARIEAQQVCNLLLRLKKLPLEKCELYAVNEELLQESQTLGSIAMNRIFDWISPNSVIGYKNRKGVDFKVMAIDLDRKEISSCTGEPSLEDAIACSLHPCAVRKSKCAVFAIGNKVVIGLDDEEVGLYRKYYAAVLARGTD